MKNIQYVPLDENQAPDRRANTNIGEFLPSEIRGVSPGQEEEAQRLIENGEFIETDKEPNSNELAEKMPKAMEKWNAAKAKRDAEALAAQKKAEKETAATSKSAK